LPKRTPPLLGDWRASVRLFDVAVEKAYGGKRMIENRMEAAIIKNM
jgi:hypothetical protein